MTMNLSNVYHHEIPTFLQEFANTKAMVRLQQVGMHCGCEYTNYPMFRNLDTYTRYDHSLGVALIIYHFTKDMKQTIAGLFHDIATPSFSHVIDFLNNDYLTQESTEDGTREIIEQSQDIQLLLKKYHLTTNDVCDYHIYPIADNDTPKLSADRLEYTLNNVLNFNFGTTESIIAIYNNIVVNTNEYNELELQFKDEEYAIQFANYSLQCSKIYVADEDRYSMQLLAEILKDAMEHMIISYNELYQDEPYIIQKLDKNIWDSFTQQSSIHVSSYPLDDTYRKIYAKKRYINPYIQNIGRVTIVDTNYKQALQDFLNSSFDYWISGRQL